MSDWLSQAERATTIRKVYNLYSVVKKLDSFLPSCGAIHECHEQNIKNQNVTSTASYRDIQLCDIVCDIKSQPTHASSDLPSRIDFRCSETTTGSY